jgi:patatin-related protein
MSGTQNIEQEVRFAIVLYGGVSLAIYINGVAQEIRNLVRATSGEPLSSDEAKGPIPVYQRLAAILEHGKIPSGELPATDGQNQPIRTRFKVDVISGTSAGGINGIFLAKSLANNESMGSLQDLWFNEGAIENLLNDKKSYTDTSLNQPRETESLLNGRRMYLKLLNAFDSMDPKDRSEASRDGVVSPLADEIDLFATTTDIEGIPVPIQLFDNVVYERRYRNAYHLRFASGERNDFQADNNPFLAFAARCTSSFPFAFEPMQLCSIDDILAHSSVYARKGYCLSSSTRWQKY